MVNLLFISFFSFLEMLIWFSSHKKVLDFDNALLDVDWDN